MPEIPDLQHYLGDLESKDKASRIRTLSLLKDKLTLAPGSSDVGDHSMNYNLIDALANRLVNDPAELDAESFAYHHSRVSRDMDPAKIVRSALLHSPQLLRDSEASRSENQ